MKHPLAWLALLLCVSMAGCSSTPPRYYLLNTLDLDMQPTTESPNPAIGLDTVELPGYLDRARMVRRSGKNTLSVHSLDQWGEPLDEGVQRVLTANLRQLLPAADIHSTPWPRAFKHDYRLRVLITQFDTASNGDVLLTGSRSVVTAQSPEKKRFHIQIPSQGSSHAEVAAAMSQALEKLSAEIARAL